MPDETAVLEQDTAVDPAHPPGESPIGEVAETETQETTETGEAQEPAQYVSPFAGKDLDEIEKDPEVAKLVQDRIAKQTESLRQRAEAERTRALREQQAQQYAQQRQQAAAASTDWAHNVLRQAAKQAEEQGKEIDPNHVAHVARNLNQAALVNANEGVRLVAEEYLNQFHPNYRIPRQLNEAFAAAQAAQDIPSMMQAFMGIVDSANRERIEAVLRAQIAQEQQAEVTKGAQVDAERKASQEARQSPKPAGGTAQQARPRSLNEILGDPSVSQAEKDRAYAAKYGFTPPR